MGMAETHDSEFIVYALSGQPITDSAPYTMISGFKDSWTDPRPCFLVWRCRRDGRRSFDAFDAIKPTGTRSLEDHAAYVHRTLDQAAIDFPESRAVALLKAKQPSGRAAPSLENTPSTIGEAGVGKTTLDNAIAGAAVLPVGGTGDCVTDQDTEVGDQ